MNLLFRLCGNHNIYFKISRTTFDWNHKLVILQKHLWIVYQPSLSLAHHCKLLTATFLLNKKNNPILPKTEFLIVLSRYNKHLIWIELARHISVAPKRTNLQNFNYSYQKHEPLLLIHDTFRVKTFRISHCFVSKAKWIETNVALFVVSVVIYVDI